MQLKPLSYDDVRTKWAWLREGIVEVLAKVGGWYLPEDVYMRLRNNSAWAYEIDDATGFAIFTQEWDADGLVLYIWILWSPPFALRSQGDELYAEFERIARESKAKRIRMQSPRRGYEKEPFFRNVATVYEHEVNYG